MAGAHKQKNQHKQSENQAAENLLSCYFHKSGLARNY
jgi:hypothetical protein